MLSYELASSIVAAAHREAQARGWKVAVAVVDADGYLTASGRMDGTFALASQIAEAKACGTAVWHEDGGQLATLNAERPGFFQAVSSLARLPLVPAAGSALIRRDGDVLGAAGASGAGSENDQALIEVAIATALSGP